MYWVVQENIRDEAGYDSFIQALRDHNAEFTVVKVIPFAYEIIPDVNPPGRVMAWGSVSMDGVAKKKGWNPGTFLNDNHDQRIWTEAYGRENMLNGDVEFYEFCKIPTFEGTKFIRPVDDKKRFDGTVVHNEEIENWKEAVQRVSDGYSRIRPETLVGMSDVKDIAMEWRFFIVNGKVISGSRYRQWGLSDQRRVEDGADSWVFAQRMVDKWQPAEAFVLDIALPAGTTDHKVIEVNCINSAGFYHTDLNAVIGAIQKLCT